MNTRRSRGRGNPRGRHPQQFRNAQLDSNGPEGRIRGTASQIYERYQALARDAQTSGDTVLAENLFQHAEHYFRVLNVNGGQNQQQSAPRFGEDEGRDEAEAYENGPPRGREQTDADQPRFEPRRPRHDARPDYRSENRPDNRPDNRNDNRSDNGYQPRRDGDRYNGEQPYVRREINNSAGPDVMPRRLREAGGNEPDQRRHRGEPAADEPDRRREPAGNGLPDFLAPPQNAGAGAAGNGTARPHAGNGAEPPAAPPQEAAAPAPAVPAEAGEAPAKPRRRRAPAAVEEGAEPRPRTRRPRRAAGEAGDAAPEAGAAKSEPTPA